jgi:hypothetical protein
MGQPISGAATEAKRARWKIFSVW